MKLAGRERLDVAAVRADHPIEVVVAASGVELTRRGHGLMGCCPFHDDSTASLSVHGVANRFHCFGCGAGGDVIEYVHRFTGLSFVDAVQALEQGAAFRGVAPATMAQLQRPALADELTTTPERAHTINLLAWEFFTTPANIGVAQAYLRDARGIGVGPLCAAGGGKPVVGYARADWRALSRHLLRQGVTDHESLDSTSPSHPLTAHVNMRAVSELGLDFGSDPVADQARLRAVSGMEQTRLEPRGHARIDLHVRPLSDPALHRCCELTRVLCDDLAALRFRQGYHVLLDNAQDLPPAMKVSP